MNDTVLGVPRDLYSVIVNLAATVGAMWVNGEIDEEKIDWSDIEAFILPKMVKEFMSLHEVFGETYEESLLHWTEETFKPVLKRNKKR